MSSFGRAEAGATLCDSSQEEYAPSLGFRASRKSCRHPRDQSCHDFELGDGNPLVIPGYPWKAPSLELLVSKCRDGDELECV
jgi:hypothetical protein